MLARDVPKVWRSSRELSAAYEQGCDAGRKGVAAEGNPWMDQRVQRLAVESRNQRTVHAGLFLEESFFSLSLCGVEWGRVLMKKDGHAMADNRLRFSFSLPHACKRCIRAIEAERRRLEQAWEQGRLSTHPK